MLVCDVTQEAAILDATADAVKTTGQDEFGAFMAARWPGLVRLAYGLTGDRWLAEDVAQTALASAYAAWWRVRRADDPDAPLSPPAGRLIPAAGRQPGESAAHGWPQRGLRGLSSPV